MRNKKGFTLIELLAVIIILGIILAIAVPKVLSVISSQKGEGLKNSTVGVYKTLENTVSMFTLGMSADLAPASDWETCPTTAWSQTGTLCEYNYTAGDLDSLEVRLTTQAGGKFTGATINDSTVTSYTYPES